MYKPDEAKIRVLKDLVHSVDQVSKKIDLQTRAVQELTKIIKETQLKGATNYVLDVPAKDVPEETGSDSSDPTDQGEH